MNENKKSILNQILTNENEIEKLFKFFEKIYYENDLISFSNCFNYNLSEIEISEIINIINENDLKIILKENY